MADKVVALLTMFFGVGSLVEGYRLWDGIGGIGLLPATIGVALVILGLALIVFPPARPFQKGEGTQRGVVVVCAACVVYVFSLSVIGYGISTVVFVLALSKYLGASTHVAIGVGVATSLATFVAFRTLLSMPLPISPFGF